MVWTGYAKPRSLIDTAGGPIASTIPTSRSSRSTRTRPRTTRGTSGSVALDWEHELRAMPRRDFVSADQLAALLRISGHHRGSDDRRLVKRGNNNWFAAFASGLFRMRGVEKVQLLDRVGQEEVGSWRVAPSTQRDRRVHHQRCRIGPSNPGIRILSGTRWWHGRSAGR